MGEIAEMMLDGTLCEGCCVYLPGEAQGSPRRCRDCRASWGKPHPVDKVSCPVCGKRVKFVGLRDHKRAAHGREST